MPEGTDATTTRTSRCANHPGEAGIAACELCGRWLCVACAVPVRGRVIGPECLASVVEDAPPLPAIPSVPRRRGDGLAIAGFALVTALSIFPWSRFGESSNLWGAWRLAWSLPAVLAGALGLMFALAVWRRPIDQVVETVVYGALALVVAVTALLHDHHPPPLTVGSAVPCPCAQAAMNGASPAMAPTVRIMRRRVTPAATPPCNPTVRSTTGSTAHLL